MLAQPRVHVGEDHAELVQLVLDLVVDDLRLVLGRDAAQELLLRLGDPELVPGALDVLGQVVPRLRLLLRRADEVVDVVEVDVGQVGAPPGHGPALEVAERLEPELPHPVGLVLQGGDLLHDPLGEPLLRLEDGVGPVLPVEPVALGELLEMLFLGCGHALAPHSPFVASLAG